ncbi:hypothetical protein [Xanthobacter autotrophicus]|uniref:hypothetical protein n=2 Tax=Xanthobacter autotrophicus TaxID=280 RepID=UPI00372863BF
MLICTTLAMARATLTPYLAGAGQKANLKQRVLADALRHFALAGGQKLRNFVALLSKLPRGLSEIRHAEKLARGMPNRPRAALTAPVTAAVPPEPAHSWRASWPKQQCPP